ncbi:DNA-binding protein, partial [Acinetobacter baumannii]|nr:DNA-binding protein [Acinetobacter baumannii]
MKKILFTTLTGLVLLTSSAAFARTDPALLNQ